MKLDGLGAQQLFAVGRILAGTNVLLTGPAGTGKSEILKRLVDHWDSEGISYALTASTGIAAIQIGGRTLHSAFSLSPNDDDEASSGEALYKLVHERCAKFWTTITKTWKRLKVLVIDEISMVSPTLVYKLHGFLQLVRLSGSPFGGLQVIFVGDFYQLPPVGAPKFLFEYPWFYTIIQERLTLTELFRQRDPVFGALLNRMRSGSLTEDDYGLLESRLQAPVDGLQYGVAPTELWSTNRDVERYNTDKLSQLKGPMYTYGRHSGIKLKKALTDSESKQSNFLLDKFLRDLNIPESFVVKGPVVASEATDGPKTILEPGAQVMLTFNLDTDRGLVNGSRGVVVGNSKPDLLKHRPMHRSIFHDFDLPTLKCYVKDMECPIVTFLCNGSKVTILVPWCRWTRPVTLSSDTKALAYCWAIPLKLAWATTVHKSQGQSLDSVSVSLDRTVFADGQAYVAVSRARTLAGLTFKSFDRSAVMCNERVKRFYEQEFGHYCETIICDAQRVIN
jgi:ATP-dependent DNA helicase PIF1